MLTTIYSKVNMEGTLLLTTTVWFSTCTACPGTQGFPSIVTATIIIAGSAKRTGEHQQEYFSLLKTNHPRSHASMGQRRVLCCSTSRIIVIPPSRKSTFHTKGSTYKAPCHRYPSYYMQLVKDRKSAKALGDWWSLPATFWSHQWHPISLIMSSVWPWMVCT